MAENTFLREGLLSKFVLPKFCFLGLGQINQDSILVHGRGR
jgi:hypothetical protein